jgi:hypothetical protein
VLTRLSGFKRPRGGFKFFPPVSKIRRGMFYRGHVLTKIAEEPETNITKPAIIPANKQR